MNYLDITTNLYFNYRVSC